MTSFQRYIGIDYSGAATAFTRLPGLRVYMAVRNQLPLEVRPHTDARRHWTRREIAHWLCETLRNGPPAAVGIDHGFSFPRRYFQEHRLEHDWPAFLRDFTQRYPAGADGVTVNDLREGLPSANARWRRLTEQRAGAKSVFHFDVPGSVAKSTHAGLPWLQYLREALGNRVHIWPFEGWSVPTGKSLITEAYPSLWSKTYPMEQRSADQHDAYTIAAWLSQADASRLLDVALHPVLSADEKEAARIEGWIIGGA